MFLTLLKVLLSVRSPTIAPMTTREDSESPSVRNFPLAVRGSLPYWDQQPAFNSFSTNVDRFRHISLFWYYMTEKGEVHKYAYAKEDRAIIEFAHANKVSVSAVITNLPDDPDAGWDSSRVEAVLEDPVRRTFLIGQISEKLSELGFDGVSIDYEAVDGGQRGPFSLFIKELSGVLHKENKYVGVALHPKTGEKADERYRFQDWRAIGQYADYLYIMAYGEHWDGGSPGPIASMPWVERISDYAIRARVPRKKVFLGIPLYGYDWEKGSNEEALGLTYTDVQRILGEYRVKEQWDPEAQTPYFIYENDGQTHEVWFENAKSVEAKVSLADRLGFGGVTFWRLGGEDPEVWEKLGQFTEPVLRPSAH
ncbi:MAG: hypothetical protein A3F04_01255 [Candidatus Chisholmbacteria bacterium RIFCSPHIGHO2_12_FULL_49_9]|uniref:GH18 domain-containing protein n=1 Tax=Candidatus Chisholmbacteria bacterium RIFCSPHIGHO2_01_FULL_52_32 TaxID=1797591 RepID=A0A1G1VT82_9BACT|nr:MAG: hypothetical protein A2786_03945 [Candidatus Chisholmbacteria bacterium RIFCSPHIGHO2_01_FULL_52_32]OGY21210.1 MAG: hypothetical protein A3F04_01255 [Candidatus Chisholmbacteria bacterium RIFCSPHIGHO2_12_FULL_49_9]